MSKNHERLAVLSLNIFCRPEGIHSGQWFHAGDNKDLRVALLLRKMANFDVVILQEMFEAGLRHSRFIREARAIGFHYHCGSIWPRFFDTRLIDGGLLILSRYPIVKRDQFVFSQGSGSDGICAKGVLYARIQLSPAVSDFFHVFTTHTQAGDNRNEYTIRLTQLEEMHRFIATTIQSDPQVPILITGDFNLDARHDLVHDYESGRAMSTRCRESKVYQQLVTDLDRVVRAARQKGATHGHEVSKSVSKTALLIIDLMKQCDRTKLRDELHPITNGDGHSSLVHQSDPLSLEKDGKCIDYMFFFPSEDENPRFQLHVVEKSTTVDHCIANELTNSKSGSTQGEQWLKYSQLPLPITHLSDHYGLIGTFVLELSSVEHPTGRLVETNESLVSVLQRSFSHQTFAQRPRRLWMCKLAFVLLSIVAISANIAFLFVYTVLHIAGVTTRL
ncbi:hypothetical protein CCR75_005246 [Bremia lactucae]|uniref:sphingomyelin phosphodiesterase n=1 Tax=Bremia lactucae TaxID=4779 RepID=A0A976IHD8_BRELC|nr:hypothetical protein CCR75_005246 [Bremia lactucae]